ncbi:MAG: MBL fold metallo-hydrolase [Polyangiaceae bacterium]
MKLSARMKVLLGLLTVLVSLSLVAVVGCRPTTHPAVPATLGAARSSADLEAVVDVPGPVAVETVDAADWKVDRAGLINLDHPKAKAAHLESGPEPIQIFFHALRHPTRGLFIVDTGVERRLGTDPEHAALRGIVASAANADALKIHVDTATWLAGQPDPLAGVLLTHLHLDHILGLPDVPKGTPIYVGAGETSERTTMNVLGQGTADRALEGHAPIQELAFSPDPKGVFDGVLDLFGDGSVWAIAVPGHTAGSVAYLARTPSGPILLVGDASHTAFGWENGVEPGTFTKDAERGAKSFQRLQDLVARHPAIRVRLGHQHLGAR